MAPLLADVPHQTPVTIVAPEGVRSYGYHDEGRRVMETRSSKFGATGGETTVANGEPEEQPFTDTATVAKQANGVAGAPTGNPRITPGELITPDAKVVSTSYRLTGSTLRSDLDQAVATLRGVVSRAEVDEGEYVLAARLLRGVARERRRDFPRIASVALLLSDALVLSEPQKVSPEGWIAMKSGADLLLEPFVPEEREEKLFRALVDNNWTLTSMFDPQALEENSSM
jgi:hypothetical protein